MLTQRYSLEFSQQSILLEIKFIDAAIRATMDRNILGLWQIVLTCWCEQKRSNAKMAMDTLVQWTSNGGTGPPLPDATCVPEDGEHNPDDGDRRCRDINHNIYFYVYQYEEWKHQMRPLPSSRT